MLRTFPLRLDCTDLEYDTGYIDRQAEDEGAGLREAVRPKASLGGALAFLAGRMRRETGGDAVTAVGKVLVRPSH